MTREEKAKAIRAGQAVAWAEGKRWGYHFKGDLKKREQIAAAVELGEMSCRAGAIELGISPTSLCMWMKRHGYKQKCVKNRLLLPTERELRARRQRGPPSERERPALPPGRRRRP